MASSILSADLDAQRRMPLAIRACWLVEPTDSHSSRSDVSIAIILATALTEGGVYG